MTKKKGIASKLFLVLVALTLLSCCFLGTTFARYTSGGTGSATTGVALWKIDGLTDQLTTVNFNELSPAQNAYGEGARSNSTGYVLVATLTNSGEVDAKVTITAGAFGENDNNGTMKFNLAAQQAFDASGYSWNGSLQGSGASYAQAKSLFSIALYQDDTSTYTDGGSIDGAFDLDRGATVYIFAQMTWTTNDANSENDSGAVADAIDTWVGMNVDSIVCDINCTAVQGSELDGQVVS